jgi:flagellar biosynthetic protein FliR
LSGALGEIAIGRAVALALAAARAAGLVAASPWPGQSAPVHARGGLALALGACALTLDLAPAAAPGLRGPAAGPWWTSLALGCALEVACGLVMGLVVRLAFSAADVLGASLSYALGLSTPVAPDPETGAAEPPVARLMTVAALALALAAGVHRDVLARLLASYRALPPGAPLALVASVPELVNVAGASIVAGASLAAPFVASALAVQLVLAFVGRAAPSLQLFSVGFTLLTLAGLSLLASSLEGTAARLLAHLAGAGAWVDATLAAAAGR